MKLDGIDSTVIIFVYTRAKPVISLLVSGDMPDGMHKSAKGCDTNPTYIAAKKAKHLEDRETTPKSCPDAVFKLLETNSQKCSQNSLSESVRLLQSQLKAERLALAQLRLEVKDVMKMSGDCLAHYGAIQLGMKHLSLTQLRSHQLVRLLAGARACQV